MNLRSLSLSALTTLIMVAPLRAADEDLINADRPGIADGSGTLDPNQFQIEAGFQRAHANTDGPPERDDSTPTLLRYGLAHDFEIRIETNGYSRNSSDADKTSGLSPVSAGFKWRFQEQADGTMVPSIAVIARLFPPTGSSDFKSHRFAGDARLVADLNLNDHWSINPNVGIAIGQDPDGRELTSALAAFTLTYSFNPHIQTFADFGAIAPETHGGGTSLQIDGGVAWIVGKNTQVDFAFGPGVSGSTTPVNFWTAGFSERF